MSPVPSRKRKYRLLPLGRSPLPLPARPTPAEWHARRRTMIAEAAYHRAAARGFHGGDPVDDWLAAEAEIDARLEAEAQAARPRPRRPDRSQT